VKTQLLQNLDKAQHKEIAMGTTLDPKSKQRLQLEFEAYRTTFLKGMDDIEDEEDMAYYVAIKYVEVKAHWIQMNLRLNYQAVLKGSADQYMLVEAALLSHFLSLVEPHVDHKQLSLINDLLATRLVA
jgi:hypothetical protein